MPFMYIHILHKLLYDERIMAAVILEIISVWFCICSKLKKSLNEEMTFLASSTSAVIDG